MTHVYTATVRPDRLLELPPEARELLLPGQEVEVEIVSNQIPISKANEGMLATLREIAELQKDMKETDGSDTQRLLREARSGAMYGYEPTE